LVQKTRGAVKDITTSTENLSKLIAWFQGNSVKVIIAFSGGVDSAVLAFAAKNALGKNALCITANYKTLSDEELLTARKVAAEIGIDQKTIKYDELKNPEFVKNDELRCYHCRKELANRLVSEAHMLGVSLVVDGTNTDDLKEFRPGIKALRECGVKSPFLELGLDKSEIRSIAKQCNLSIHDRPSNACLASRIPKGTEITFERLKLVEKSEIIIKETFDVKQVRVREHGEIARIEVGAQELSKLFDVERLSVIDRKLRDLGFKFVTIDVRGYRSGSLSIVQ
jgi:pyridinium-3,5-biscarboxylic acid mononucleotide sulfurtransferase